MSSLVVGRSSGIGRRIGRPIPPNTNPYVRHLLTVYSQSKRSNAGTRGLDVISEQTYVETALDRDLLAVGALGRVLARHHLGQRRRRQDGLPPEARARAEDEQATVDRSLPNGARFELRGRTFLSNYDGSQDEGDQKNDDVLRAFLAPVQRRRRDRLGTSKETRLIAINEGRLVDFLEANRADFAALAALVKEGLRTGEPAEGVAVVNLNLRSVVTDPQGFDGSILERLVRRMTHEDDARAVVPKAGLLPRSVATPVAAAVDACIVRAPVPVEADLANLHRPNS